MLNQLLIFHFYLYLNNNEGMRPGSGGISGSNAANNANSSNSPLTMTFFYVLAGIVGFCVSVGLSYGGYKLYKYYKNK